MPVSLWTVATVQRAPPIEKAELKSSWWAAIGLPLAPMHRGISTHESRGMLITVARR